MHHPGMYAQYRIHGKLPLGACWELAAIWGQFGPPATQERFCKSDPAEHADQKPELEPRPEPPERRQMASRWPKIAPSGFKMAPGGPQDGSERSPRTSIWSAGSEGTVLQKWSGGACGQKARSGAPARTARVTPSGLNPGVSLWPLTKTWRKALGNIQKTLRRADIESRKLILVRAAIRGILMLEIYKNQQY